MTHEPLLWFCVDEVKQARRSGTVRLRAASAAGVLHSDLVEVARKGRFTEAGRPWEAVGFSSSSSPLSCYALFRRTLVYGRALSEILPLLAWCHSFRLQADCAVRAQPLILRLASGDPIFPGKPRRLYDSKLEERFARDFRRVAPDWDVIREPEAVQAGDTLIFPDFALRHRGDGRRWLVEIVGFGTRDYVERKLALLRVTGLRDLVLCIDESRNCADGSLPSSSRIIPFRRRLDATAVLHLIEHESAGAEPVNRGRGVPRRRG